MQKSLSILLITALIIAFGTYVYFYPPRKNPVHVPQQDDNPPTTCIDCEKETQGQTFAHFSSVVGNYRREIWDDVNNRRFGQFTTGLSKTALINMYNNTDARTIWFDMDTIKRFICTIEKYNKKLKKPGTSLGIRYFYAVYDANDPNITKQKRHTLFMVPTYRNSDGSNVDFDPRETFFQQNSNTAEYTKEYQAKNLNYVDLYNPIHLFPRLIPNALMLGPSDNAGTSTNIVNNGEICPTNCPSINTLTVIDP